MAFIEANDANFYYKSYGTGVPVICISGYAGDHQIWTPIINQLSEEFQVIVFDNRGVGQTQDKAETLSVQLMAQDVAALSNALGLENPHIIGQSMGASIAQTVAANYPNQLNKLALISSTAKWRKAMLFGFSSLLKLREQGIDFDTQVDSLIGWVYGENYLQQPNKLLMLKDILSNNPHPQSLTDQKRQFRVLATFNGIEALTKIKAKTFIGHGAEDIVVLAKESKYLSDNINDSISVEFDCGHAITGEVPAEISKELIDFLKT